MIDEALEPVRRRDFVRHAHAAVQLHRLLSDEARSLSDARLRSGNRLTTRVGVRARVARGREIRDRARLLGVDQHLDHAMLQRLKARDRRAELLAVLRVVDGGEVQRIERADGFRA